MLGLLHRLSRPTSLALDSDTGFLWNTTGPRMVWEGLESCRQPRCKEFLLVEQGVGPTGLGASYAVNPYEDLGEN